MHELLVSADVIDRYTFDAIFFTFLIFFFVNTQTDRAKEISDAALRGPHHQGYSPLSTPRRLSFLRPSGCSERVEPDDIAREICRHCAATELRGGNMALPLTSPCYNAIRSSLFVPVASPSRRPSTPSRAIPQPSSGFHFDGPTSQFHPAETSKL